MTRTASPPRTAARPGRALPTQSSRVAAIGAPIAVMSVSTGSGSTSAGPLSTETTIADVVARIVWADDGEEQFQTVALGWTRRNVYVRVTDTRCQFTACWLDAADVKRR
jgi:hypothetical protein